jgi:predicted flap endonuclease-1-like 5' DNA nuclease
MTNRQIADALDEVATLVAAEDAAPFRANAYRRAARTLRSLRAPIAARFAAGGLAALDDLPGIGPGIARAIAELIQTGHLRSLDRPGHAGCEAAFATVPGIGPVLAHLLHHRLDVHTLEQLEAAAHDGRLARVPGFGARRVRGVRETLAGRLGQHHRPTPPLAHPALPVAEILDVDREYRDKAARELLVRIAPRRFNPKREAWLPVLRATRDGRQYTALFSNTARAHALGKTGNWVVLYVDDGRREREATVVTETSGPLAGRRVIRGREQDCAAYYEHAGADGAATFPNAAHAAM